MRPFIFLLAAAAAGGAVEVDYFPLQIGNQWIYRPAGRVPGDVLAMEVVRAGEFGGRQYVLVRGFGEGDAWLRMSDEGRLMAWNEERRAEVLWADFPAAEGTVYQTAIPPCNQRAQIASRSARYTGPVGEFRTGLEIRYLPGSCADAGWEREVYLPWVGLLHRTATTIAGPRTYDLIYARLGGVTVISDRETAFSLSLDRAVYFANLMPPLDPERAVPQMMARLSLRNTQETPLELTFGTGQRYDLVIRNERGEIVYRWSEGRAFTQALGVERIAGERNWTVPVRLGGAGQPFPEGKYIAEAWLTTLAGRLYTASVGFEIRHTR